MFTSIDKALVALFAPLVFLLKTLLGFDIGISAETFAMLVGAATTFLVWLVPNKPWTEK